TGLEQAVAAPSTFAKSSSIPQFSGPFNPLPPETTISASAMLTLLEALSTESTCTPLSGILGEKSSAVALAECSFNPKELLETPTIFTSVSMLVKLKALLVKAVRFTVKGDVLVGASTTFDAYPASRFTANRGAKYLLSAVWLNITIFVPSFSAACLMTFAYVLALNVSNLLSLTFKTLSTP